MRQFEKVVVGKCKLPPNDPRVARDPAVVQAMAESLRTQGQKCPILVYRDGEFYVVIDGLTRWSAAKLGGLTELEALVFDEPPSPAEQSLMMATIDVHRTSLSPIERARLLGRIQDQKKCGVGELATLVSLSQSQVSKLLALLQLDPAIQKKLETGELDLERAYILSRAEPAKQMTLAGDAGTLDRNQLRQQVMGQGPAKSATAKFALCTGMTVSVQGRDLSLTGAIDALTEAAKELKKSLAQNLDLDTAQRVMKDKSKSRPLTRDLLFEE